MPRVRPLRPGEAQRTLAQRLTGRADRLRQLNTRFGLRARRVFLVHTRADGDERGEGDERVVSRVELLPTPRVGDATVVNQRPWSGGTLPEGSLRIDQISAHRYTLDMLTGVRFAPSEFQGPGHTAEPVAGPNDAPVFDDRTDFFYEIVEDDRGDRPAARERYRVVGNPWRNEGALSFGVLVEAASEPMARDGNPASAEEDL